MTLYSGVVPNWLRKACNVWAYTKSGEAAFAKLGPQKMKTTLAEMITPPPWSVRLEVALGTMASRVGRKTAWSTFAAGPFAAGAPGAAFAATAHSPHDSVNTSFKLRRFIRVSSKRNHGKKSPRSNRLSHESCNPRRRYRLDKTSPTRKR